MTQSIKGLNILQFNDIKDFSLTKASELKSEKVSFIYE